MATAVSSQVAPEIGGVATVEEELFEMPPFDPAIHLAYEPPAARHTFTELGLAKPDNAPDMCFTEPFQLFSEEGVRMLRRDLFRKEVLDKHLRAWYRAPCVITSHEKTATWVQQAWRHPATQAAINKAAGFPLKPLERTGEVGYVNIQLGAEGVAGVYKLGENPTPPLAPSEVQKSEHDGVLVDSWHKDWVQMVCVLMLSDTSTMDGGETAIKTGDGTVLKARGAKMGGAVMMQGGHTYHAALPAKNAPERVSMVTSYTFADPDLDDSCTSLRSLDPDVDEDPEMLCNEFLLHKLQRLKDRIDVAMEKVKAKQGNESRPTREEVEPWIKEQITYLKHVGWELFEREPYMFQDAPEGYLSEYLKDV